MAVKILLVEDSSTQGEFYRTLLEEMNLEVVWMQSGQTALQYAYENHPDLVILDLNLPDMDGVQVCSRIKRTPETADIPVIMLTSRDRAHDAIIGINAGAVDYIAKDDFASDTVIMSLQQLGIIS